MLFSLYDCTILSDANLVSVFTLVLILYVASFVTLLQYWNDLRKPNGECYACPSHSHAVHGCLRNRTEWAHLIDLAPKVCIQIQSLLSMHVICLLLFYSFAFLFSLQYLYAR